MKLEPPQSSEPTPTDLPAQWRTRAVELRRWGADDGVARAWERAAAELEASQRRDEEELLTLTEAANVGGYTADSLGRMMRKGKLANAGRKNAPRVRRGDVPMKLGGLPSRNAPRHIDRAEIARAVINRHVGGE